MDVQVPLPQGGALAATLARPTGAPRGGVVLLHGFASDRREFADLPERLATKGWLALAVDSRAHGAEATRTGRLAHGLVVEDLAAAAAYLRKEASVPLGLVAHSMGGALACHALPRLPVFEAAALVAPMDTVRAEISSFEFLGYRVGNALSRARIRLGLGPLVVPYKNRYEDLFLDPAAVERARAVAFLSETVSLANYDALLALDGARWATKVDIPTLVVLARHDKAVKNASSKRVYDALRGPKRLVEIDSGHSLWGDLRAAEAADALDAWFGEAIVKGK